MIRAGDSQEDRSVTKRTRRYLAELATARDNWVRYVDGSEDILTRLDSGVVHENAGYFLADGRQIVVRKVRVDLHARTIYLRKQLPAYQGKRQ